MIINVNKLNEKQKELIKDYFKAYAKNRSTKLKINIKEFGDTWYFYATYTFHGAFYCLSTEPNEYLHINRNFSYTAIYKRYLTELKTKQKFHQRMLTKLSEKETQVTKQFLEAVQN